MHIDSSVATLLAEDVVKLEDENRLLKQQLLITREMLSETLDIAHRSIAYVASAMAR